VFNQTQFFWLIAISIVFIPLYKHLVSSVPRSMFIYSYTLKYCMTQIQFQLSVKANKNISLYKILKNKKTKAEAINEVLEALKIKVN